MISKPFEPSDAAYKASEYYNALPQDERAKLAPLLEYYRQMGLAETRGYMVETVLRAERRIKGIRESGTLALAPRDSQAPKEDV